MAIKIKFDGSNTPLTPTLILANRNGKKLGQLKANSIAVKGSLNNADEISFNVHKYLNGVKDSLWDNLVDFKLVWCREWDCWFEITVEVNETNEQEAVKTVYCTRLGQAELSQIILYNIEINTENDISRDDYKLPTVLFDEQHPEASLLHRIMGKAPHYSIIHVDNTIADIQRTFSFNNISIYDAFQEISEEIGCLFIFHSDSDENGNIQRTVSVYDLQANCQDCGYRGEFTKKCPECNSANINEGYGNDTTIFVTSDELGTDIQLTTDTGSVKNCFRLEAGDDLMTAAVRNCNPNGTDYIWYITDDVKTDMSDELVTKLNAYDELYDYYQNQYAVNISASLLNQYNALVTKYQNAHEDLQKLSAPITGYPALMTAYYNTIDFAVFLQSTLMPTVSLSATNASAQAKLLTRTNLSPVAVTDISTLSSATANSAVLSVAKLLVDSRYQVKIYTSSLSGSTWVGNFTVTNYSDENDTATSANVSITINDDYKAYVSQKIRKSLHQNDAEDISITGLFAKNDDDFCAELKKYCLDSLTSFHDICQSCIDILIEQGIGNKDTWDGSNPDLYKDLYVPYYNKLKAIQAEIAVRQSELDLVLGTYNSDGSISSHGIQTYIIKAKEQIQNALNFEKYLGKDLWSEFCAYRREDTYSNSNFISDGLNNAELFEKALEFIRVANNEIYKSAELQHSISASLKNLLVIKRFEPLVNYFEVGNWLRIRIDDGIYKLRLLGYEIDFDHLENISVEFSDVMKIANGLTDAESILSQASSMASSYDSVQRQASQGAKSNSVLEHWVEKGLDATNTKIIGGADNQTQTWDNHGMLFRKYNSITDDYADEQLKIINSTLAITNDNWETVKTAVGGYYYFNPIDGKLTYAYGVIGETIIGKIILGENLGIYNTSGSLTFDDNGFIVTNGTNTITINPNAASLFRLSNVASDIMSIDDNGNGIFSGKIISKSGEIGGWTIADGALYNSTNSMSSNIEGIYFGTDGIRSYKNENSYVNIQNGTIVANNVDLSGKINALTGYLGGWIVSQNAIKSEDGSVELNSAQNALKFYTSDATLLTRINNSGISNYDSNGTLRNALTGTSNTFYDAGGNRRIAITNDGFNQYSTNGTYLGHIGRSTVYSVDASGNTTSDEVGEIMSVNVEDASESLGWAVCAVVPGSEITAKQRRVYYCNNNNLDYAKDHFYVNCESIFLRHTETDPYYIKKLSFNDIAQTFTITAGYDTDNSGDVINTFSYTLNDSGNITQIKNEDTGRIMEVTYEE